MSDRTGAANRFDGVSRCRWSTGLPGVARRGIADGGLSHGGGTGAATRRPVRTAAGVFGVVRNPIYLAMFVFWLGITLVGYLLLVVSIELQVRFVEEPYLLRVHRDAHRRD